MALSPSPQPTSRTSPWIQPPVCHAMTLSLGALASHGGVVIGAMPSPGLWPRYSASKSMCCDLEASWEELEPVVVISTRVIDLNDTSSNDCSGQSASQGVGRKISRRCPY